MDRVAIVTPHHLQLSSHEIEVDRVHRWLTHTNHPLCFPEVVWARIEKRRRLRRQESDGDGGAGEKKERKTKAEVDGYHRKRHVGERNIKGGHARPC